MMRMYPWLHLASNFNVNADLFFTIPNSCQIHTVISWTILFLPSSDIYPVSWSVRNLCALFITLFLIHDNPRPHIKYINYVFCLLPFFLNHKSTAPYQLFWLCVLFTTFFFDPWIHSPISNILIMCFVYYIFCPWTHYPVSIILIICFVYYIFSSMNPHIRYQISWLCILFTTFFYPWMHRPEPNTLIMCFAYYMF